MQYDPIKKHLGNFFKHAPWLRILFYRMMDIHLLRTWHVKKHLRNWKKNHGYSARILDAGSGFGQYSHYLSRLSRGYVIEGVELNAGQVNDCNRFFAQSGKAGRLKFSVADLTTYVQPVHFDLILSVDVMEHIENDTAVFRNFHHSLVPGGMLLVSTPSDKGGSDAREIHDHSFIDEHVRNGYAVEEMRSKLTAAGFHKIEISYSYGFPGKISWKLAMKLPFRLLGIHRAFFILLPLYFLLTYPFILILNYLDIIINHNTGTGLIVRAWK